MELHTHEPRVLGQLDDLDEVALGVDTGEGHPVLLQLVAEVVVDLVAVAVPLAHVVHAVDLAHARVRSEAAVVVAEPHRPALLGDLLLLGHQGDDRMWRGRFKLGRVRLGPTADVPGELDHGALHPEADPEEWCAALAGEPHRLDLALDPALAEAGRDEDARDVAQLLGHVLRRDLLGVDGHDLDPHAVRRARDDEALGDRLVGVLVLDVLADECDPHLPGRVLEPAEEVDPAVEVGRGEGLVVDLVAEAELLDHDLVDALLAEQ